MQVDLIIIFLIHVPHFKMVEGFSAIKPASIERSMAVTNSSTEPVVILFFSVLRSPNRQVNSPKNVSKINSNHWHWLASFSKRPSPVDFGFQLILLLFATILSRTSVTLINQESKG